MSEFITVNTLELKPIDPNTLGLTYRLTARVDVNKRMVESFRTIKDPFNKKAYVLLTMTSGKEYVITEESETLLREEIEQ